MFLSYTVKYTFYNKIRIYMWVFVRNTAGQLEWRDRGVPTVITESSAMVIKHVCWILGLPPNSRLSTGRLKFH